MNELDSKHINDFLSFLADNGSDDPEIIIPCSDGQLVIISGVDITSKEFNLYQQGE